MMRYLLNISTFIVNMLWIILTLLLLMVIQQQQYEYGILQNNMAEVWKDSTNLLRDYKELKRKKR